MRETSNQLGIAAAVPLHPKPMVLGGEFLARKDELFESLLYFFSKMKGGRFRSVPYPFSPSSMRGFSESTKSPAETKIFFTNPSTEDLISFSIFMASTIARV